MSYLRGTGVVEDADVVEVAVSLGVVESVTHHELVGDFEADVAHVHWPQAALGLIHQGRDADGMRLALIQHVHQIVQGYPAIDRKSTRLNSSHANISYAVFCLKK